MVVHARLSSNASDKKRLNGILGKKNLSRNEIKLFQNILIKSGSKKYAQDMASKYFEIGKTKIEKVILMQQSKNFLKGLVEFLEKREI